MNYDMEIFSSHRHPNSMFSDALPSLKLNVQGQLSDHQFSELQKKRHLLEESLQTSASTKASLQGQGAVDASNSKMPVFENLKHPFSKNQLQTIPEDAGLELAQMESLKLSQEKTHSLALNSEPYSSAISAISVAPGPKYVFSRYFIIKSYTEEDVHKAIKYFIWSSTERGNRILDQAYMELQQLKRRPPPLLDEEGQKALKAAEVYLFFSVNKSKHFCGVAKMCGRVAHAMNHENLWKQPGKWPGSIKISWLHIKDLPNTQLIHIENPYNENKPACQGRDCQEVYPKTGEKML